MQHYISDTGQWHKARKKKKSITIEKKNKQLYLFPDKMVAYVDTFNNSATDEDIIGKCYRVEGYKVTLKFLS